MDSVNAIARDINARVRVYDKFGLDEASGGQFRKFNGFEKFKILF